MLLISNDSLPVADHTMFAGSFESFELELTNLSANEAAKVELPILLQDLTPAQGEWQT